MNKLLRNTTTTTSIATMKWFAEIITRGELRQQLDIKEDGFQLGGDFTIDTVTKMMLFLYPQKTAADRLPAQQLLKSIR